MTALVTFVVVEQPLRGKMFNVLERDLQPA